jgi:Zn-dependent alcohol dehydrogenase
MAVAAVMTGVDQPLEIRHDVEVEAPRTGEIKVAVAVSGVCHTDLSMLDGAMTPGCIPPMVLGHEAAGVVQEVGPEVATLAPGDHVVLSWVSRCGACFFCRKGQVHLCEAATLPFATGGMLDGSTRATSGGMPLRQMAGVGSFADTLVTPAVNAVRIDDDVDLQLAALLGCAVVTGTGAALNTADIAPGDTVAVVGCGGVGLNVIQGARIRGAGEIIAVDTNEAKLALAKEMGATLGVHAGQGDPVSKVMGLTGQRGADVAFEVIGLQRTIDQTIAMTRRGGQAVLVGIPDVDTTVCVPAFFGVVLAEKTIRGCWYGSSDVQRDVPELVRLYRAGRLQLDRLISRTIALDEVADAFATMRSGEVARTLILHGGTPAREV